MLWTFAVNRTLMFDTERTWLAWPDLMSAHFDLQPAIAACRTGSTGSLIGALHRGSQLSVRLSDYSLGLRHSTFQYY